MSAASLLERCEAQGITVQLGEKSLRVNGPPGSITPEMRAELAREKAAIRVLLQAEADYDRVHAEVGQMVDTARARRLYGDEASYQEMMAEVNALVHGRYWDAHARYLELAKGEQH